MIKNKGCCDLKYAKQLKTLGVKQDSLWCWTPDIDNLTNYYLAEAVNPLPKNKPYYSAFTVAELGERLPWNYCSGKCSPKCDKGKYWCQDWDEENEIQYADTEANARAKTRIWLIENKKEIIK